MAVFSKTFRVNLFYIMCKIRETERYTFQFPRSLSSNHRRARPRAPDCAGLATIFKSGAQRTETPGCRVQR
eukprot:scaffold588_cov247-Pinguiococcus_pyrenoidosus.AAC.6